MEKFIPGWFRHGVDIGAGLEAMIERLYEQVLVAGSHALDAGAHVGRHTFPMAKLVGEAGRVHAIEPIPRLANYLRAECERRPLPQVEVVEAALADREGSATFQDVETMPGYSGLQRRDYPRDDFKIVPIEVRLRRIDSILAAIDRKSAFWKLDLEGGEFHALSGGRQALADNRPIVVFENGRSTAAAAYGYTPDDWFSLFHALQFDTFDLFGNAFTPDRWDDPACPWYFIAAPRSHELTPRLSALMRRFAQSCDPENT